MDSSEDQLQTPPRGYPRSVGSARGEARRRELLERVTDVLGANGLVDFSLRRAARAAATTHKVLLYHFESVEDLLTQAVLQLRERRIERSIAAAAAAGGAMSDKVRALWPVLTGEEAWVLDQAIGLATYDPARYAALASDASARYMSVLESICPERWDAKRTHEVAEMVLATLRGLLIEWRTTADETAIRAGLAALTRALDAEEAAL